MRRVTIGTRGSSLARCQAEIVRAALEGRFPGQAFAIHAVTAHADRNPDVPLTAMSGEGVFVKELETALLERQIDLAVHSLKDVPLEMPRELCLGAILERGEPRDALVSRAGLGLDRLPAGTRVGTSSIRRRSQLMRRRQDLALADIRGNVDTRLRKLDEGQYDAVVLAACGLIRLGLEERITEYLDPAVMLPEPGQGALAIEMRSADRELSRMVEALEHPESRACVEAERSLLHALGGGCRVPIAAYASLQGSQIQLEAAVVAPDGSRMVRGALTGDMTQPQTLGERLARQFVDQGALELLRTIHE